MRALLARRRRLACVFAVGHARGCSPSIAPSWLIWVVAGSLPLIMMFAWIGIAADGPIAGYDAAAVSPPISSLVFYRPPDTPLGAGPCRPRDPQGELSARAAATAAIPTGRTPSSNWPRC